ncbi:MAG: BamA/TamA family outer membrane protein [Bacteroidetes bacterium]|nr:BamA/TamA family outer membrane protein [Bacteroidota bacterium]
MRWLALSVFLITASALTQAQELPSNGRPADSCLQLPDEQFVVRAILPEGNKVTREHIIMREMEFRQGDTLSLSEFCQLSRKSRQNLLNRGLFNFVDIRTVPFPGKPSEKDVVVDVTERWYVWPFPIFELAERNFNSWWELRDLRRTNYGFFVTINNFRGRMEVLRVLARAGYNQNYYLNYEIPYLNRKQSFGASLETGVALSRETFYAAKNHKYLHYKSLDGFARRQGYFRLTFTFRPEIHNLHAFTLAYENFRFADTLVKLNPEMGFNNQPDFRMFRLAYRLKHDFRDSRPYPLNGHYFELNAEQRGLGLLSNEPAHTNLKATFDLYRPIKPRWNWAFTTTVKTVIGKTEPYQLRRGLGYGNEFVRGYELYVVDGRSFGLFKSNIKYTLVKPQSRQLPVPVTERFSKIHYALYLNALFDAGYVHEPNPWPDNFLQNRLLYGTGLGLDLVTYYDLVWRFELSLNHLRQSGFFLHFVAPI